jgi:hypothetical protein
MRMPRTASSVICRGSGRSGPPAAPRTFSTPSGGRRQPAQVHQKNRRQGGDAAWVRRRVAEQHLQRDQLPGQISPPLGLELHQPAVDGGTAVTAQRRERKPGVALHGLDHVIGLVRHALQHGAGKVRLARAAGDADEQAAGVRIPVRRAEPGEGGDEIDVVVVRQGGREWFGIGGPFDDADAVAQPLHRHAGDEDGALKCALHGHVAEPPRLALRRNPGVSSSSQASLVAEK